ncbi:unnamed protein product [Linum trigynum]|uniref:Secreted protein n=1 Tax=Linum trigynum TaxID=586398 RepID=A0AAV2DX97_9ROSI
MITEHLLVGGSMVWMLGHHAAISDGDGSKQLAQLLVVPHRQLHVSRDDSRLLVISRRSTSSRELMTSKRCSAVDRSTARPALRHIRIWILSRNWP